jgi:2-oxoglutarate ferredoxin oxidoreductase subunit beta
VLKRAGRHRGASFVEILQNCIVYKDDVFGSITDRALAPKTQIHVAHGEPLVFGKDRSKGLRLRPGTLDIEIVSLVEGRLCQADLLRHDENSRPLATLLAAMQPPALPLALGVLYCAPGDSYDRQVHEQLAAAQPKGRKQDLNDLLRDGHTWTVPG